MGFCFLRIRGFRIIAFIRFAPFWHCVFQHGLESFECARR
jgi:hypothetical protein